MTRKSRRPPSTTLPPEAPAEGLGCVLVFEPDVEGRVAIGHQISRYRRVRFAETGKGARETLAAHEDWCGFVLDASIAHDGTTSGLDLLATVRERWPETPSLVTSDKLDRELVNRVASLGAVVVGKPFGEAELGPFLRRVVAFELGFNDAFGERLNLATRTWKLSLREHEILAWHLAGGSRDEYLSACGLSEGTFKTYVKRMLRKIGGQNLGDATQIAFRRVLGTPSPFLAPKPPPRDPD
ncbi:MAG: response regulator transcription factor [Deltaproteobacteria bacterium]|nr:response regulator transcription factor [Deltaproteobacteria bacterium]